MAFHGAKRPASSNTASSNTEKAEKSASIDTEVAIARGDDHEKLRRLYCENNGLYKRCLVLEYCRFQYARFSCACL